MRWIFDLGYPRTEERKSTHRTLLLCAVQLVCEAIVDVLSMYRELKSGIPLLNVWTGRNKLWVCREIVQMTLAAVLICLIYHVVPYAGFCERSDDVCSCSFTDSLPAVAEYCGDDAISIDGLGDADLVANITALVRQVVDATSFCAAATQKHVDVCS